MIVLINPNSTIAMTEAMQRTAGRTLPGVEVQAWTSHDGPPSIQGAEDGDAAVPPMLELVQKASDQGASAIIIGCFDDTGLYEARDIAACPVIGIGQAAYHVAACAGGRFSVVTTLAVSVPILESNIVTYGLSPHLSRVRASDVPVLELESDPKAANAKVIAEIKRAEAEDGVQAIALGCAGMAGLLAAAQAETDLLLVDGVRASLHMAASLSA